MIPWFFKGIIDQLQPSNKISLGKGPAPAMDNVFDCKLKVRKFKLQSQYHVHFRTNTLEKGMNSSPTLSLQVFWKDGFGIE